MAICQLEAPEKFSFSWLIGNVAVDKQKAVKEKSPSFPLFQRQQMWGKGNKIDKTWLPPASSCSLFCTLLSSPNLCFGAELPFKDGTLIWSSRMMPWKSCSGFGICSGIRAEREFCFKPSKAVLWWLTPGYTCIRWFSRVCDSLRQSLIPLSFLWTSLWV